MKQIILFVGFLLSVIFAAGQNEGYEIKITFKPFKNQHIYLGHYFGKTYPIIDSVMLNDKSEAIFKGDKALNGGIYLIGYPNKSGFFEVLIDKQQHFSIIADTATIGKEIKFENSSDNVLFNHYQQFMTTKGKEINKLRDSFKASTTKKDSATIREQLTKIDKDIANFRSDIIKNNPGNILTALLLTMKEPALSGRLQNPTTQKDSIDSWQYFKSHFWDDVSFYDGRMAYTTFFEEKLDKYFSQLVVPHPDSIIKELDWMLGTASINPEMTRFLLIKYVNRYLNQKYMWEDAVFLHLFEKYFAQKNYSWLTEAGKKTITDRAYSLMANIMKIALQARPGSEMADSAATTVLVEPLAKVSAVEDFLYSRWQSATRAAASAAARDRAAAAAAAARGTAKSKDKGKAKGKEKGRDKSKDKDEAAAPPQLPQGADAPELRVTRSRSRSHAGAAAAAAPAAPAPPRRRRRPSGSRRQRRSTSAVTRT